MEFTQFKICFFDKEDGRGKNKMGRIFPYIQYYGTYQYNVIHLFTGQYSKTCLSKEPKTSYFDSL